MAATDHARSLYPAERALEFARRHLQPKVAFVVKIFQGEGFDALVRETREWFDKVMVRKPDAFTGTQSRSVFTGHR